MPILGLTDRTPAFKEIGRLRLGISKAEAKALKSGPKEIPHFRPDFRPDALDAQALFMQVYCKDGKFPTAVNIRLPFPEIGRCWDAFYEVYNTSGMLGMSDGERWLYLRNNKTGELLVKDGVPSTAASLPTDANGMPYMPFDRKTPVYSYKSTKGEDVAVYARPTGRLKVLIPELKRAAYIIVITHSVYNIMRISEQLAAAAVVAQNAGMTLPLVPLVLSRRKENISVSFGGKKTMQEHYLLNIEIDPLWMEAQFRFLNTLMPGTMGTLLLGSPTPALQLPEGDIASEELEETDDEQFVGNPTGSDELPYEDEPEAPKAPPAKTETPKRPYPPEMLREGLVKASQKHAGKTASDKQIGLTAMLLTECFAGEGADDKRHTAQMYLTGEGSLKNAAPAMVLALLDWLKPTQDSGGAYHPDPMAVTEANALYDAALKQEGQAELPLDGADAEPDEA
jgi:hypothetical protein